MERIDEPPTGLLDSCLSCCSFTPVINCKFTILPLMSLNDANESSSSCGGTQQALNMSTTSRSRILEASNLV